MTEEEKNNIINNPELDSNKNPEIIDENIDNTEEEFDEEYSLIDTELTGKDKITENNIVEENTNEFIIREVKIKNDSDIYILPLINATKIANIKKCNEYTSKYGLILSDNQINNLLERRKETLEKTIYK